MIMGERKKKYGFVLSRTYKTSTITCLLCGSRVRLSCCCGAAETRPKCNYSIIVVLNVYGAARNKATSARAISLRGRRRRQWSMTTTAHRGYISDRRAHRVISGHIITCARDNGRRRWRHDTLSEVVYYYTTDYGMNQ